MIENNKLIKHKFFPIFNVFLFLFYTIFYEYIVLNYPMGTAIGNLRYYCLLIVLIISVLTYILSKKYVKKDILGKELLLLFIPAIVFALFSYYYANRVGRSMELRSIVQILMFLLPGLYSFVLINNFNMKKIYFLMQCSTLITVFFYFTEPGHTIIDFFNLDNWMSINFFKSISFTESHNFFDTFLQLFLFFNYYSYVETDINVQKKLKRFRMITGFFAFLSFKRLGVLFLIFMLVYGKIKKSNFELQKKSNVLITTILIVVLTIIYTMVLKGELFNFSYDTLFNLTSGRKWYLDWWKLKDYFSYGYGTSMFVIGRFLEMDLVEIYLELNIICLFIFIYTFLKISYKNKYSFLIMLYVMANMLTSSSLPWTYGWIIMFITTASISTDIKGKELQKAVK